LAGLGVGLGGRGVRPGGAVQADALHGEGHRIALLYLTLAAQDLHGKRVFAPIDLGQLQARHMAGLAIGLPVQEQAQAVAGAQARFDVDADHEGAVVGTQGILAGNVLQRQSAVSVALLLGVLGLFHHHRLLSLHRIGRLQLDGLAGLAFRGLVGEDRIAVGIGVFVDLRGGRQGQGAEQAGGEQAHRRAPE